MTNNITLEQDKSLVSVYADGFLAFSVHKSIIEKYKIKNGDIIDDGELENLRRKCLYEHYLGRANYLLSLKDYCKKALIKKLGDDTEIAAEVTEYLVCRGFVNDERYAENRAINLKNSKKSDSVILYTLRQEGLSADTAQKAVDSLESDNITELTVLIKSKYASKLGAENGKRKVTDALIRRGYSYSDIKEALENFSE